MAPASVVRNPLSNATVVRDHAEPEVVSSASRKSKRLAHQPVEHEQPQKKQRLTPTPSIGERELTDTEKARREKLEKQPLAIVIDPLNVGCKRCGGLVKLTKHHLYDFSHWKTHRQRCDRWSQAELEARLEKSTLISSRLSTPSLILDAGSDLTDLSSDSEPEASPPPDEGRRATHEPSPSEASHQSSRPAVGPFSSHLLCVEYLAMAHPGAKAVDLNAPLEVIPEWSFALLKLPAFIDPDQAEAESQRCTLSSANWGEEDSEDEEFDEGEDRAVRWSPPPPAPPNDSTLQDAAPRDE